LVKRSPVAVMIDNSPKARPQHGLSKASVVYEILAEGGITRFMGIYLDNDAEIIGPVRSARHYFLYAALGYGAVYAHCGGSPQAYEEIEALGVANLDDMSDRGVFWRSGERVAPYNLYTSGANLRGAIAERRWESTNVPDQPWKFTDEPQQGRAAASVHIPYPNGYQGYSVSYEYDRAAQDYKRFMANEPHADAVDGSQLRAKTIIVLYIKSWPVPKDPDLRIEMETVGSGKGLVFAESKAREIRWAKNSKKDQFILTEAGGTVLTIPRGNVWVEVVPLETEISFK